MGNRAVVIEFGKQEGIYQHWNGGRDSIEPMLYYAKNFLNNLTPGLFDSNLKKVAFISMCCGFNPEYSKDYTNLECNNGDNGTFVINKDCDIIERLFYRYPEQKEYDFNEVLLYIDENMPKNMQKGKDFILKYRASEEVKKITAIESRYGCDDKYVDKIDFDDVTGNLQVGDIIYYNGDFRTIIGINDKEEAMVNGRDVGGKPFFNYTEKYGKDNEFYMDDKDTNVFNRLKNNPNSYLGYHYCSVPGTKETIKVLDDDNFRIVDKNKLSELIDAIDKATSESI